MNRIQRVWHDLSYPVDPSKYPVYPNTAQNLSTHLEIVVSLTCQDGRYGRDGRDPPVSRVSNCIRRDGLTRPVEKDGLFSTAVPFDGRVEALVPSQFDFCLLPPSKFPAIENLLPTQNTGLFIVGTALQARLRITV